MFARLSRRKPVRLRLRCRARIPAVRLPARYLTFNLMKQLLILAKLALASGG